MTKRSKSNPESEQIPGQDEENVPQNLKSPQIAPQEKLRIPEIDAATLIKLAMLWPMPLDLDDHETGKRFEAVYRKILIAQVLIEKIARLDEERIEKFIKQGADIDSLLSVPPRHRTFAEAARELFRNQPEKSFEAFIKRRAARTWDGRLSRIIPTAVKLAEHDIEAYKSLGLTEAMFDDLKKERHEEMVERGRDNRMKGLGKEKPRKK